MKNIFLCFVALVLLLASSMCSAGWLEKLGLVKTATTNAASLSIATLSQDQMVSGLKEALGKGVEHAVGSLGKENGFLKDVAVKIPMPDTLKKVESGLRILGQDQLADDFVASMNHAAEQAVPEAAAVLGHSIQQMTLTDAKAILTGTNNAATQYFRRTSETNLYERFHPIVAKATEKVGVTSFYKTMMDKASFAGSFLSHDAGNLDDYITHKALDGLFMKIAEEERNIRENPMARTTDLLKKVFGASQK